MPHLGHLKDVVLIPVPACDGDVGDAAVTFAAGDFKMVGACLEAHVQAGAGMFSFGVLQCAMGGGKEWVLHGGGQDELAGLWCSGGAQDY
jgi:hypothetical protein